jgi:hypothetical protein
MPQVSITLTQEELDEVNAEVVKQKTLNSRATFSNVSAMLIMRAIKEIKRLEEKNARRKSTVV